MPEKPDYDEQLHAVWSALRAGVESAKQPFHTGALANVGSHSGEPFAAEVRTVVIRDVDGDGWSVGINSDLRSPKIKEIESTPGVSLLFYDAPGRRQIRLRGRASIHNRDAKAAERWKTVADQSRECYRSPLGPSTTLSGGATLPGDTTLPADRLRPGSLSDAEAFRNFCFVAITVTEVEALFLDHRGHQRLKWVRTPSGVETVELAP